MWGCTSVIPALGSLSQEDLEFKVNLGHIVIAYLKKQKKNMKNLVN
jgi:hypothetical protein